MAQETASLKQRKPLQRPEFILTRTRLTARRTLIAEIDALARRATFERAKRGCERCGTRDRLQWHHVFSRAIVSLRWDLDNLLCLCSGCHLWWHHNPLEAAAWFTKYAGADRCKRLHLARHTIRKTDLLALRLMLERQVEAGLG